tara:strand:+ start:27592 stop:28038 length:447 start_codon:yes stop_codon:yes gene_type:complete
MKKLITILFIGVLTLSGCSSDDGNNIQDPLIGEWKQYSYILINTDGSETETIHSPEDCSYQNTFIFKSDGSVDSWLYFLDKDQECSLLEDLLTEFTWLKTDSNNYKYTFRQASGELNTIDIEIEFFQNDAVKIERFDGTNEKTKYIRL